MSKTDMIGGVIVYLYGVAVLNTLNPFFIAETSSEGGVKYEVQLDSFKPQVYDGFHPNEPVHIPQNFNIVNY